MQTILLANPRGFCAGVERAIAIVERALEQFGAPIYVRHEVVHNRFVVDGLKAKGAIFIEDLAEVPAGATLIFSAHGVSQAVRTEAATRGFKLFDATCPLVTKVHLEVSRLHKQGYEIVMIGHKGHPEVEGTMGQATGRMHLVENVADVAELKTGAGDTAQSKSSCGTTNAVKLAYVTQTTLSVDDTQTIVAALKKRFPSIIGPKKDDICYATQNRQDAVKAMTGRVDVMIVVGSKNSSNSNRLREVAENSGIPAHLVDNAELIDPAWLVGKGSVGVTAGASAPELLVSGVVDRLRALGAGQVELLDGVVENVNFPLPKELVQP
ncbi:4-hydroxy-3-methylbut-2-enyl diphosphate reductase [Rugosibacter aromaticivorans]|uniref:4-hydroxy-3-methylbut-2-enyl diphosphate reductase n=1 Tax=Rugosibacter aromaticivorans TaxID=1565605 RepID=A0A0C5JBF3_9PROT|nr:4-hydroxy-3-methylbut-2-enyl diphosphate reductase [Rugosibacter aromaticivorans]AJP49180.1 4-hydroxy-3-methylbut-2-enyl diphosphate reductase [Rugosibacter aromaticivorans]TBR15554.1 MAG: 4-hydroxy-3-methylbut-2-enyl diphosphate reductase [Rugosibacter sp.]